MDATTTPEKVRGELGVDNTEYPDASLEDDISAAEGFVTSRLGDYITDQGLLNKIATLVAADMVFPRVTGENSGQQISSVEQGSRSVSYANSSADSATGNSPHWQQAVKLDYTGRLETNNVAVRSSAIR